MTEGTKAAPNLEDLEGDQVILDVDGPFIYIGTLSGVGEKVLVLTEADVHFCSDSESTTEYYLLETKRNEVRPNRSAVYVMRDKVVGVSRLADIKVY
ncbi:MAG: hypothetical protein R6V05_13485 [Candidatus Brocadiia bacterium]